MVGWMDGWFRIFYQFSCLKWFYVVWFPATFLFFSVLFCVASSLCHTHSCAMKTFCPSKSVLLLETFLFQHWTVAAKTNDWQSTFCFHFPALSSCTSCFLFFLCAKKKLLNNAANKDSTACSEQWQEAKNGIVYSFGSSASFMCKAMPLKDILSMSFKRFAAKWNIKNKKY